jgi:UPF0716 protein FxsA
MHLLTWFALIALAEVATFFWVGSEIGLLWALGIAIITAMVGAVLVRRAGLSVIGEIRRKRDNGQFPGRELVDGAAILVAGAFLISPGFITDLLGFLLLVPTLRAAIYRVVSKRFSRRVGAYTTAGRTGWRSAGDDVPGAVIDVDSLE